MYMEPPAHSLLHSSLTGFYRQFLQGGERANETPTSRRELESAMRNAFRDAGCKSEDVINSLIELARAEREMYGYLQSQEVGRVPGSPKPK